VEVGAEGFDAVGGVADEGGQAVGEGLFWLPDSQSAMKVSVSASSVASLMSRVIWGTGISSVQFRHAG
jgi:hypothetical protein